MAKGGGIVDALAPIGAGLVGGFLGPEVSSVLDLGIPAGAAEAIGGAATGALTGGLLDKGGWTGALTGGLEGAAAGGIADPWLSAKLGIPIPGTGTSASGGGWLSSIFGGGGTPTAPAGAASPAPPAGGATAASIAGPSSTAGSAIQVDQTGVPLDPSTDFLDPATDIPATISTGPLEAAGGGGGFGDFLSKNARWLIPAAGLGVAGLQGNKPLPNASQLQTQATALGAGADQLTRSLQTGKLPAGAQAQIDLASQAEEARVRSSFAGMGLTGSTMEATALGQIKDNALAEKFKVASQLAQTGLSEAQLSDQILLDLMNAQMQQDQGFQGAIADFSSALAGDPGKTVAA